MSDTTPTPSVGDIVTGLIRTVVPYIVGWVVAVFARFEITLDDGTVTNLTGLLTVLLGTLYYLLVRFAEQKWPGLGWLLGSAKQPTYANSKTIKGEVGEVEAAPVAAPKDPTSQAAIIDEVLDQGQA
jgi:hypothetical protein